MNIITAVLGAVVALAAWWWFVTRNRPAFPPLMIDTDDPLMQEALRRAKETIPQLLELFEDAKDCTTIKLPVVTSSGDTEHLWADLLSIEGSTIHVRYTTPPVTHLGKFERLQSHPIADIEDWVVKKDPSKYIGGYSMRVMFQRGREQWGDLPSELKAEEIKYG